MMIFQQLLSLDLPVLPQLSHILHHIDLIPSQLPDEVLVKQRLLLLKSVNLNKRHQRYDDISQALNRLLLCLQILILHLQLVPLLGVGLL